MVLESLIVFVVSLLLGAFGIYAGARLIADVHDYRYAIVTALLGALIWAIVGLFFGWIPFLGPILVFIAYLGVINWRYPGGWVDALLITVAAWLAVFIVLYVLALVGFVGFEALGVPGL